MDGGILVSFFYPRDTFGLRVRHDAWPLSIGLRYVVPAIRSLLDEVFVTHNHLPKIFIESQYRRLSTYSIIGK
jgi:hypothetical protein